MVYIDKALILMLLAVAPDASNYGSLVFLSGSKVIVGVIDDQGRTDYKMVRYLRDN